MVATDALTRLPAFRGMARADLETFKIVAPPVSFRQGAVLLRQGEAAIGAFLVVSGRCRVEVVAEGRMAVVGYIGAGEVAGELGLFTKGARRSATVVAEQPVEALILMPSLLHEPVARPVMAALERRTLANMAERVRTSTATYRRLDVPPPPPQRVGLGDRLRRLWS